MPIPVKEQIRIESDSLQADVEKELISEEDHKRFLYLARKNAKEIDWLLEPMVQAKYARYFE